MNSNNQYFETLQSTYGEINEGVLTNRINECQMVLNELASTQVWRIVISDAQRTVKFIDENWQTLNPNDSSYQKARIAKLASKQLVDLPREYLEEMTILQDKLKEFQNPDTIVEKDNDNN